MKFSKVADRYENRLNRFGYKIVSAKDGQARSLYDPKSIISLDLGSEIKGKIYLGTSKKFVVDYYSGLTEYPDLLLTYQFNVNDVIKGDPNSDNGEITVSWATLKSVEEIKY